MKFLIDTNILISLEPTAGTTIEPGAQDAAAVARLIQESGNQIVLHPLVLADIARDPNQERRRHREHILRKYPKLEGAPLLTTSDEAILGSAPAGSNDWVDNHMLIAVQRDAVDHLVTQDQAIHRRAARLGLEDRVLTTMDALAMLRALFPTKPIPPPAVRAVKAHTLDNDDPIFDSFRGDYLGFDDWLRRCKLDDRPTWIIEGEAGLAAVCIAKAEKEPSHGMFGSVLKICSFKVSDAHLGVRYGELLLKTVFVYAHENRFDWLYVTVFEKHAWLIALLQEFGFSQTPTRTSLGELVMAKPARAQASPDPQMSALAYAIRYGPCSWTWNCGGTWIVPIQPRFDRVLFPERQEQTALLPGLQPSGNAIRKAYLSHSPVRSLAEGDVLVFYRSTTSRSIRTIGVVENWIASKDTERIQQFVARRTVYSMEEIRQMSAGGREVLAVRFRQVLHGFREIPFNELLTAGVLTGAPQSIMRVRSEGLAWLKLRLQQSP